MKKYILAVSTVALVLTLSACSSSFDKFSTTVEACGSPAGVTVQDNGTTLVIDMAGEDDYSGASFADVSCIINTVGTPSYIISQMETTTALSGTQRADYDGISVSWSYHPNNGLDVIYHKN